MLKKICFIPKNLVDPATGESFPEIEPHSFSFNSPHGACPHCHGLGRLRVVAEELITDKSKTFEEGGIIPWAKVADKDESWTKQHIACVAKEEGIPLNKPLGKLTKKHLKILFYGAGNKKYAIKYKTSRGRQCHLEC